MSKEFSKYLIDYFKNKLSSSKDTKCKNCKTNKKFISQVNDTGGIELIYSCGKNDKSKCGVQYGLVLPEYIDYDKDLDNLLKSMYTPTNYGSMERNNIKIDIDYEKIQIENKNNYDKLKELFDKSNGIDNREKLTTEWTHKKNEKLKNMNKLYKEIKVETNKDVKKQKMKSYLDLKIEIDELNKNLREIKQSIHIILKVSDGKVVDSISIKEPVKEKVKEKEKVVYENKEVEIELYELTDIDKFKKRTDVFDIGKEDECKESISWEELKNIKNKKEYYKKLYEISTNPMYPTYNQIYFTAADVMQFQKYGYLKTRILSYPNYSKSKYDIYNRYNVDTTYKTFQYIFHYLKKGVYVSIKNNKLITYLSFNNIDYTNEWSDIILKSENKVLFDKLNRYTSVDPKNWYANNCLITSNGMKFKYSDKLAEGDKTIVPFKHFMLNYIEYLNKNDIQLDDVDFFFNPRDFPILKENGMDPYDQIVLDKKIKDKFIHDTYTPILSQCGHTKFHDICIPTEDDMMRITDKIYPDMCSNNYYGRKFDTKWKDKKPTCVFRGGATGCGITPETNMRIKACKMSHEWSVDSDKKDLLDAKLTSWNNKPKFYNGKLVQLKESEFDFDASNDNKMDIQEQSTYKYILNIDGHVKAFRLGNELRMGSVVLIVESDYRLWFQEFLVDKVHYVSVSRDLSDLEDKIKWCIGHDEECEQISKNAKDFYDKYLSEKGTYEYFHNIMNSLSKCRAPPVYKMIKDKLNIIVAYRNTKTNLRKKQLDIFIQQMTSIFTGRIDFHIYVIEQESDRDDYDDLPPEFKIEGTQMAKFNLGRIKNIGYEIANKERKGYYVLSDVDLLPGFSLINDYLRAPTKRVIHLANIGTRFGIDDKNFIGGVVSVNSEQFEKSNGYPNNFWGWGGEDNAFLHRLRDNNIKVRKSESPVIDLEEHTEELKEDKKILEPQDKLRKEKVKEDETNWKNNGVSNVDKLYSVINRKDYDNVSHIKVFLKVSEEDKSPEKEEEEEEESKEEDEEEEEESPKSNTQSPSPPPPSPSPPPSPPPSQSKEIIEGSRVVWTKNGEDFEGEIVKISPKTYKICCKPGKNKDDKGALYMVPKDIVKLK